LRSLSLSLSLLLSAVTDAHVYDHTGKTEVGCAALA